MNFNLVEMYNGLLRFNKHILNELAECIRKKIKDKDFLIILDEIIDSTDSVRNTSSKLTGKEGVGVPIGNSY
nr:MAG: MatK/TrnK amino terminal region [Bacteriophage sp.]